MLSKNSFLPHLALFIVNAIYGFNFVIAKDVMPEYIKPFGFILIRVIGAVSLFWIILILTGIQKIEKKDFLRLAAGGIFGVAANQLLFFAGLNLSSPINGSILMTATPITILAIAVIFTKEKITIWRGVGIVIGAIGAIVLVISSKGDFDTSSEKMLGNIFILINAFSYAIYMIIIKPLMKKYNPLTVITWVFTFGLLFVLPFGYNQFTEVHWQSFGFDIWWKVVFVIVGVTFITYLFNVYALKYLDSSVVGIYIYVQPIIATLHSIILQVDYLNTTLVICSIMIFLGVYLVSRKPVKSSS